MASVGAYNRGSGSGAHNGVQGQIRKLGAKPLARSKMIAFSWMYVHRIYQISPLLVFGRKLQKLIFTIVLCG